MVNLPFQSHKIEDRSFVAVLKREIHLLAGRSLSPSRVAELDIVVSELCSNLIKYADGGEVLYRLSIDSESPLFELICIDNGPGIENLSRSRRDGVSTGNSLGQGLGSIQRLANDFQCYSVANWGTISYVRFRNRQDFVEKRENLIYRNLTVALEGESVSGDVSAVKIANLHPSFLVADGLGHGEGANVAAKIAADFFLKSSEVDPAVLIRSMNATVAKTRGCVANIAHANFVNRTWEVCGIGNIALRIYQGLEHKNYVTNNGIIGMALPNRFENMVVPMASLQQLIFCSDGIKSKWSLHSYIGILRFDPMLLAAAIYKDNSRGTDDCTILIIKEL